MDEAGLYGWALWILVFIIATYVAIWRKRNKKIREDEKSQ
tara:strand:- start:2523 stop:2642 length:120 start_codon:yes stop_codon:yes gene_type:complete